MLEKHLFEYAIIRVVPRVEREEFINVGVILYCAKLKYLECIIQLNDQKLLVIDPEIDLDAVKINLKSFQSITRGDGNSGPIGLFDQPSRFRWLTATRSTIIQCSKVHPGFCIDPNIALENIHQKSVL